MLIKIPKGWEIPEREATPEGLILGRRELLKNTGAGLIVAATAGLTFSSALAAPTPANADPSATLYPFKRNPKYVLDRPLTNATFVTMFNNYYEFDAPDAYAADALMFPIRPWEFTVEGMVEKPFKSDIDTLMKAMPLEERLYRHRCVERWSFTAPWSGFPMKAFMDYCKPTSTAKYVVMKTVVGPKFGTGIARNPFYPWPYTEGLTIEEANNELAFLATGLYGKPLPKQNGAPLRLVTPWKYGFKSVKAIKQFVFTDQRPKTYWQALQPDEYGFWANVNPNVAHPRWSQATEEPLGTGKEVATKLYNGYTEQVAGIYATIHGEQLYK